MATSSTPTDLSTLLKTAASALRSLAAEQKRIVKTASAGPVINLTKLKGLAK